MYTKVGWTTEDGNDIDVDFNPYVGRHPLVMVNYQVLTKKQCYQKTGKTPGELIVEARRKSREWDEQDL